MTYLTLGLLLIISIHLVPSYSTIRQNVVERFGQVSYMGMYSVVSVLALGLIIAGKIAADFVPIWTPPFWTLIIPIVLMPFSFILLVAALLPTNIKRFVRHPMVCAVMLWSLAHLSVNGDLSSIILFSTLGVFCLIDLLSTNKRRKRNLQTASQNANSDLKAVSYSKHNNLRIESPAPMCSLVQDGIVISLGLVSFCIVLYFHKILFNYFILG